MFVVWTSNEEKAGSWSCSSITNVSTSINCAVGTRNHYVGHDMKETVRSLDVDLIESRSCFNSVTSSCLSNNISIQEIAISLGRTTKKHTDESVRAGAGEIVCQDNTVHNVVRHDVFHERTFEGLVYLQLSGTRANRGGCGGSYNRGGNSRRIENNIAKRCKREVVWVREKSVVEVVFESSEGGVGGSKDREPTVAIIQQGIKTCGSDLSTKVSQDVRIEISTNNVNCI